MLKGYKTVVVVIAMFLIGGFDAIRDMPDVPQWIYAFVYPAIVFVLRYFTETPIFHKKPKAPPLKPN
jgi:hypothetical protein